MNKIIILVGNSLNAMINFREKIIDHWSSSGIKVYIICPFDIEPPFKKNVIYINFAISTRDFSLIKIFNNVIKIKLIINRISLDPSTIIFPYTPKIIFIVLISLFNSNYKIYPFFSGLGGLYLNSKYLFIQKLLAFLINSNKACLQVICLNNKDKLILSKFIRNKEILKLNGEGIDCNKYKFIKNNSNDKFRFILISRPLLEKGVLVFLKAVEHYNELLHDFDQPRPEFIIYGFDCTSNLNDLPSDFIKKCLKNNIKLYGNKSNLQDEIKSKDILLIPSFREGMSRVCMEMTEYGLPVIGNNVPGIQNIIKNTGILINNNDPIKYAEAIKYFIHLNDDEFINIRNNIKYSVRNYFSSNDVIYFYNSIIN
jgi:glycosyltransferase involved in cell wall biosynthesis